MKAKNIESKIKKVGLGDKSYPTPLLDLKDKPKKLYYLGNLQNIDWTKALAVVGSRRMTTYGRQVIDRFIPELVANETVIISGFMYGVDTYAHSQTVDLGGITVAVLANGLDICYPPENEKLYKKIIETGGVILSEYPLGTKPQLWTYPKRNRIVAALSLLGTLVIEAGDNSGSLITAKLAKKLKRKVYAVPGPITSSVSMGTNNLIRSDSAKVTLNTSDLISIEQPSETDRGEVQMTNFEAKIYQTLLRENLTLDELCLVINADITEVSTTVSLMSLKGIVEEIGGKLIAKKVR